MHNRVMKGRACDKLEMNDKANDASDESKCRTGHKGEDEKTTPNME
jgi:hypothetical protein